MRRPPSTGRYQIQANDITSKHADADSATFIEFIPNINKSCKMEYLETEHILSLTPFF
jgi:hypothetical protein